MNIPNFIDSPIVDKEGRLTPVWKSILMQLITELQKNASDEGIYVPSQSAATILSLGSSSSGALLYNSDTNKFMACEAGSFRTITTV